MKQILQGTDGIRGYIEVKSIKTKRDPVKIFEEQNILIPEFFELYAYAFCIFLKKNKLAKEGDYIMIGKDTRDSSLRYTTALLNGIVKAGMKLRFLNIVPSPLVSFYLVKRNRSGALMITASHNPHNQNGIKLFLPPYGAKLLPIQEQELTTLLYNTPYPIKENINAVNYKDLNTKAIKKYSRHILKNISTKKFPKTILMVDCANGAVSQTLKHLIKQIKFKKVNLLNTQGTINDHCGITELAGIKTIASKDMLINDNLNKNRILNSMFREGKNNPQVICGELFLSGFVFDGDGDRFMRLEYNHLEEKIYCLSGDTLAIHFLNALNSKNKHIQFYHTIESDLQIKIYAEQMGWKHDIIPIGDRWLLKKAIETKKNFSLGYEASGHFIFPTKIKIRSGKIGSKNYIISKKDIFFTGDGILASLKSLESIFKNCGKKPDKQFFQKLTSQYLDGIFQDLAIYNVDKFVLLNKNFIKKLTDFMEKTTKNLLDTSFSLEKKQITHSPDLQYWFLKKEEKIKGAIFVRNSGTEDKVSLYLRGEKEFETKFTELLKKLNFFLIPYLQKKTATLMS